MAVAERNIAHFLRELPLFTGLADAEMNFFLKAGALKTYEKDRCIFLQGDHADRLFIVVNGWLKLCRGNPAGEETVMALLTRGDVFGGCALFGEGGYPLTAQSLGEVQTFEIPAGTLKESMRKNPEVMTRITDALSREIDMLQREYEHLTTMLAPQRIGCLLIELFSGLGGTGGTFTLPFEKSLAAALLGMKPETFSRALAQMASFGVTVKGMEIKIESFTRLREHSCGPCSSIPGECKGSRRRG